MVERSRRGKGKRPLLGSHQRCWLWGRNLVRETLAGGRWPIIELWLANDLPPELLDEVHQDALARHLKVHIEDRKVLDRLGHTSEHQGYLAKMGPFPYASVEELLAGAAQPALFLVLDSIQDPYNFGAMLRSARAFGVDAVFIGRTGQVPVTSMVARSSAGVINRVGIAQVESLAVLVQTLRARGVRVVGAAGAAAAPLSACDFRDSTAIVIGNEGAGVSREVLACCDEIAAIPLEGQVESLNAAAAAAVFFYEIRRQRASGVA